ncbi:hypothetical protein LX32DRAFT_633234 [Colletotrichum zoysiae]|uniref:Uncharacterized protein n=1 Tax=Colletotrichum zoysiae TaxID=1216348 RepID=A0AAD9HUA8_9PEZI|nr:hypothetical protein LX32DRAFT_633234 [Colletotrichum zoysiae]
MRFSTLLFTSTIGLAGFAVGQSETSAPGTCQETIGKLFCFLPGDNQKGGCPPDENPEYPSGDLAKDEAACKGKKAGDACTTFYECI